MSQIVLPKSADELLKGSYSKWAKRPYVWTKEDKKYKPKSYGELVEDAWALAAALLERGLKGKQVMIYSENSYEWMVADMAIMGYVGVSVGANKDWLEYDMVNALQAVDVEMLLYSETKHPVIANLKKHFPHVKYIQIESELGKLLDEGRTLLRKDSDYLQPHIQAGDKTCKIVFTSGSTSIPKAVTLTVANMTACGPGLFERSPTGTDDIYYLFLPLHHVYAAVDVFMYSFFVGAQVYISADAHDHMVDELKEIRPTVFCAVPLVYERIYKGIDAPTMARIEKGIKLSNVLLRLGIDIRQRVFRQFHEVFGGRMRFMFSGGAHLDPEIKRLFKDVGANFIEGYGMTETTSLIAMEFPGSSRLEAAGKPFENLEIRIANPDAKGHGEITVKGGNVTAGYCKNPKANKEAFDNDGFFRTGDLGYLDEDSNLYVIGRKNHLIVRTNGEKVLAEELIKLIQAHSPSVVKAKVFEAHSKLSALVYLKPGATLNTDRLMAQVNNGLPAYKQLEFVAAEAVDAASQMK